MSLVKDTLIKVAWCLPYDSIKNLSVVNKNYYRWVWKNFEFWRGKLTKDYKFNYINKKEIKLIIFYYKTLWSVTTKGNNRNVNNLEWYPDLYLELNKSVVGRCQYVFPYGIKTGKKCNKWGKLYYSEYFCDQCVQKVTVSEEIKKMKNSFDKRCITLLKI